VWKRGGRGAKVEIVYSRATGYLGGFLEKRFDHSASVDVCSERLEVIPIRHSRLHSAADMRAWLNARLVDSQLSSDCDVLCTRQAFCHIHIGRMGFQPESNELLSCMIPEWEAWSREGNHD